MRGRFAKRISGEAPPVVAPISSFEQFIKLVMRVLVRGGEAAALVSRQAHA